VGPDPLHPALRRGTAASSTTCRRPCRRPAQAGEYPDGRIRVPSDRRRHRRTGGFSASQGAVPAHVALHAARLRVRITCSTTPRTLRLLETLFGPPRAQPLRLRRSVTGDMTQALALGKPASTTEIPTLPNAPLVEPTVDEQVIVNGIDRHLRRGLHVHPRPPATRMPRPGRRDTAAAHATSIATGAAASTAADRSRGPASVSTLSAEPSELAAPANPLPDLVRGYPGSAGAAGARPPPSRRFPNVRRGTAPRPLRTPSGARGAIRYVTLVSGKPKGPERAIGRRGGRNAH